jgi:hypothetical protein
LDPHQIAVGQRIAKRQLEHLSDGETRLRLASVGDDDLVNRVERRQNLGRRDGPALVRGRLGSFAAMEEFSTAHCNEYSHTQRLAEPAPPGIGPKPHADMRIAPGVRVADCVGTARRWRARGR